jgi:hypothetical protein
MGQEGVEKWRAERNTDAREIEGSRCGSRSGHVVTGKLVVIWICPVLAPATQRGSEAARRKRGIPGPIRSHIKCYVTRFGHDSSGLTPSCNRGFCGGIVGDGGCCLL